MAAEFPRAVEVLLAKAAVDSQFKQLLLAKRAAAAQAIGIELSPAEASMLAAVSTEQLEQVIARTSVPEEHRRAFLGKAAAAMLAALGAMTSGLPGAETPPPTRGITPDKPAVLGITPGPPRPPEAVVGPPELQVEQEIMELLARRFRMDAAKISRDMSLVKDLKADAVDIVGMRRQFERQFGITLPAKQWATVKTVGDAIDQVQEAVRQKNQKQTPQNRQPQKAPATKEQPQPAPIPGPWGLGGVRPN